MSSKAKLNTDIQLSPSRSQVVLVSLIVLAGICLLVGFLFLWSENKSAWIPLITGIGIICIVVYSWFSAQKDTDLDNAKPTTVSDSTGNSITTDTRALMSPVGIQNIEKVMSLLTHREPLPEPDGLIDAQGTPIPNTKDEAKMRVDLANSQAQEITDLASNKFGVLGASTESGTQPLIDEPYSAKIIESNVFEP